ncbi:MAG: amidase [Candidatus Obscuribacterales bacterium]|nr:amidase [Steroidobacteraceae bacterium]
MNTRATDLENTTSVSRRQFIQSTAVAGAVLGVSHFAPKAFATGVSAEDFIAKSATEIARMIREKEITATEAVRLFYARIDVVNPKINAVVAVCKERAFAEASECDAMTAAGKSKGALHGVPFTVKDSFDTAGVVSTGGTLGRKDYIPGKDATVVARVRAAGAILLGKTNTPEFTLGGGGRGTVNLVYGLTKNPYNLNYQPAGSSGGAGAIIAAGGAAFDIGSDYGGSIRGPAFANGIAGIKPTLGRVPRTGHIVGYGGPFDSFQETGPMARRVEDLALLMPILSGPDNWDATMAPVPFGDPGKVDLKKLRVAYYLSNGWQEPTAEIQELTKQCVGYFSKLGCKVTEDKPPKMRELADVRQKFNGADGREHMRRMLKKHGTTQASPGLRLDGEMASSADFTRFVEEMDAIKSEQLAWFEKYDLIVCPASQRAPIPLDYEPPEGRDAARRGGGYASQYNTTGWPAGVVRAGTSKSDVGLPLGIQVVAQPWRDDVVIAALAHIEKQTGGWQMPPI